MDRKKSMFPVASQNNSVNGLPLGFGQKTRFESINFNDPFFDHRIYKKLYQPERMVPKDDPCDPTRYEYKHYDLDSINRQVFIFTHSFGFFPFELIFLCTLKITIKISLKNFL
jgi:hypothetical protein